MSAPEQKAPLEIGWADERCILCALLLTARLERCSETAALTREHLIPDAIGGTLVCRFLCKRCNDNMGMIESRLKCDAGIRIAIENLKGLLPDLWLSMSEGQSYFGQDQSTAMQMTMGKGEIRIDPSKRADGSIIQPLEQAPNALRMRLQRQRASQNEIDAALEKFRLAPEGSITNVAYGISVLKSSVSSVFPKLKSQQVDRLAILKIAYEFLALNLGRTIFDHYFDPVRCALLTKGDVPTLCSIQDRAARHRGYKPFHGLAVRNVAGGVAVKVRLFGLLSHHVLFRGLLVPEDALHCYCVHLDTKNEEWD